MQVDGLLSEKEGKLRLSEVISASTNPEPEIAESPSFDRLPTANNSELGARERAVEKLRLIWDQRRFLFRVAAYGLAAAALVAFLIPKRYESTTRLMPPDTQSSSGIAMLASLSARTGAGLGTFAGDLLGLKNTGALFIGILSSRTLQDRLVNHFNLKKVYGASLSEQARKTLAENTSITEDRKSGIITITVTDRDPKRAAELAAAYVQELDRHAAELSTSAAHRERVFLEDRLKAVKQDLDAAAKDFSEFASKNSTIDIKAQGRVMVEAAATLQGQLIAAQSELKGLEQIYTDNNVRVRAVRARTEELQRQLEKLGGKEAPNPRGQGQLSEPLYPSIRKLPLLGVTYADLYRRTNIHEAVYETLTQEYELAKVQEVKEIPSVKVLDLANVPEKKSFPPRLLIMFLGAFLSLAFGVVWVLGKARWDETDPQDPGKLLAQEVLHTLKTEVPRVSRNGTRLREVTEKIWSRFAHRQREPGKEA